MIPDKYKFRYRLLASVDIIGSTAFKSGQASQKQSWAHVFSGFFEEFPKQLAACFSEMDASLVAPNAKPDMGMQVWKLVGDEILFVAELLRHEQAAYHAIALKDAVNKYSDSLASRGLGLKATIWGAGFPVMNVEVETQVAADGTKARDYLGPSVDLGFRLSALADKRRIPISADVALFLRHARAARTEVANSLKIFAEPPQLLKGIHAGGGYPMLWIDRLDGHQTAEDKLLNRDRKDVADALQEYLDEQFRSSLVGLTRPFIESDASPHFSAVPAEFVDWRQRLMNDDPDLKYQQAVQQSDPSSASASAPPLPVKT